MRAAVLSAVRDTAARLHYWIREFFGENDYPRYIAEWRARHGDAGVAGDPAGDPGHRLMTEREFFAERLRVKYGGTVQRCC